MSHEGLDGAHGFWRVPEKKGHPTRGELSSAMEEPWQDLVPCREEEMLFLAGAPVLMAAFAGWLAVTACFLLGLPGPPGSSPAFARPRSSGPALQQGIAGCLSVAAGTHSLCFWDIMFLGVQGDVASSSQVRKCLFVFLFP